MSSKGKIAASATPVLLQCFKKRYKLMCLALQSHQISRSLLSWVLYLRARCMGSCRGLHCACRVNHPSAILNLCTASTYHWLCSFPALTGTQPKRSIQLRGFIRATSTNPHSKHIISSLEGCSFHMLPSETSQISSSTISVDLMRFLADITKESLARFGTGFPSGFAPIGESTCFLLSPQSVSS